MTVRPGRWRESCRFPEAASTRGQESLSTKDKVSLQRKLEARKLQVGYTREDEDANNYSTVLKRLPYGKLESVYKFNVAASDDATAAIRRPPLCCGANDMDRENDMILETDGVDVTQVRTRRLWLARPAAGAHACCSWTLRRSISTRQSRSGAGVSGGALCAKWGAVAAPRSR